MGGIGLAFAEHLARTVHARLVLVGRTPLPAVSEWEALLKENGKAYQRAAEVREAARNRTPWRRGFTDIGRS